MAPCSARNASSLGTASALSVCEGNSKEMHRIRAARRKSSSETQSMISNASFGFEGSENPYFSNALWMSSSYEEGVGVVRFLAGRVRFGRFLTWSEQRLVPEVASSSDMSSGHVALAGTPRKSAINEFCVCNMRFSCLRAPMSNMAVSSTRAVVDNAHLEQHSKRCHDKSSDKSRQCIN